MSDEEKEVLRNFKSEYETCDHYSSDLIIELDDAEILLNLIDKQSKEIEELKQEKEYLNCIIESDKDKIKAKIEELNKDLKEYENGQEWEIQDEIRGQIEVLQSLLRKEFPVTITKEELEKRWKV